MNTPKGKKKIYYGWWIVAASFVLLFLYAGAGFYSFSIFIQPLESAFGWNRSQISLAISIYLLVHGLTAPMVGYLIERFHPKAVVTGFAAVSGLAFILVSFTQTLWYFYAAYALLSVGTTGIGYIPLSTILSRWFVKRRGSAIGLAMIGIAAGGMVMAPAVGALLTRFSWRTAFLGLGILVWVVALPVSLLVIKKSPAEIGEQPDGLPAENAPGKGIQTGAGKKGTAAGTHWPLAAALGTRAFWGVTTAFACASLAMMGVLQHQVPLITAKGIPAATASAALGLTAGIGGLGKFCFGRLTEHIPFRHTAILCFVLQSLGVLLLTRADSVLVVWLYVILFGFSMGGTAVLMPIGVADYFGLASLGVIMGIVSFSQSFGYAGGAIISGMVYDAFGSYQYALLAYIAIYGCAILAIAFAGKPTPYLRPA